MWFPELNNWPSGLFPWQKIKKNMWSNLKSIDLAKIEVVPFPENQYFKELYDKKIVVLHHTISGDGVDGDISTWEDDPAVVGTSFIVDRAGTPWQLFSSKYWAYHLAAGNHELDRHSIGIEIDSWGWLIKGDGTIKQFGKNIDGSPKMIKTISGKFYTYYGTSVACPIQEYPDGYRGYNYYEQYSESQLRTVGELILYWKMKYGISVEYNEDMWNISSRALGGAPGVWSHTSYRKASEKTDVHPQPNLIEMLKTLSKI